MKSLAENSLYNILYKTSNLVFPLIISAYVSRILMAEGVGKVSSAQNIVTYFTLLAALGLPTYGTKMIAAVGEIREQRNKTFSELFCLNAISTIICTIIYYCLIINIPYFQERFALSVVCGLAIIFNIINVDWFYQGREEYRYIMMRSLLIKVISLVSVFIFVRTEDDYIAYAAILTLSKVANNIFNIVHLRKFASFTFKNLNVKHHIKPVIILLAASIAIEIYTLADTTMLTFIHGDKIVGYYVTARKGIDVIRTMIVAVCAVFLPRLSYYYANQQIDLFESLAAKGVKILTYMTIPATIGVVLTANYFVPILFGDDFSNAILTTQILSLSIITVAFSNFFGYQILVTIGKERQMLISTIIGAIVNVVLNFILVFQFKHNGVSVASAVTELCVALYQIWSIKDTVCIRIEKKFYISVMISSILMLLTVALAIYKIRGRIWGLLICIVVGIFSYAIGSIVTKNEIALEILHRMRCFSNRNA